MGIYSAKLALESAAADAIQTPDDIGVDLDQIEKSIAGPDGIEAHRDEVEDAVEGVVGDPLEEAYMIMYESQYNYDQIMQAIGMRELSEAASGRDLVLEAVDIKAFFANVKKVLTSMFERVTTAFKKFVAKLDVQAAIDKKFVTQYKAQIAAGAKEFKGDAKGYEFPDDITFGGGAYKGTDYLMDASRDLAELRKGGNVTVKTLDETRAEIIKNISGTDATSIEEMNEALTLKLHGGAKAKVALKGKIGADKVIAILSGDRESKAIKESYNAIKNTYKSALKQVAGLEKAITAQDYASVSKALAICEHYTSAITFEKNVQNNVYVITLRAAKEKRAQARALAHAYRKAAPAVQHNSAEVNFGGSVFSELQFV